MSYAAKGEKVFALYDPNHPDCTPPPNKRSDHRLKRFLSTSDERAWHICDEVRYTHFYDLMSGSRTCIGVDQCHRYVPLEDLIRILTADKDELIKQLQQQLQESFQAQGDTSEYASERDSLLEQIAELTEEVNKSRALLRQAMHKLENIDEIVNENKKLQCRLRCSEERVKYLEEKKKTLESELAELRSKSQIQMDLNKTQEMLSEMSRQREEQPCLDEDTLLSLASERNELQEKVKTLEKELEESKRKEQEIEMLKQRSQTDSLDKEEMSKENECYRRKLASMKCLEKQIQELKKQGRALADKYKKEAQKAEEQMNRMCQASKELQSLREERDTLRKRVDELSSYECQYNKLQRKLKRVDAVIAENEVLNGKLLQLQKLEKENEYLRCRMETIEELEISAAEDKEKIVQLQCAVADQEEEMKDLLCQIERLTSGRHEEEMERLKCELYEKNSKLKLCEEQLAEIPALEAEIDELRMKLQCCFQDFPDKKRGENNYQKIEVRLPSSSKGIRMNYRSPGEESSSVMGIRREEKIGLESKTCQEMPEQESGVSFKVTAELSDTRDVMSCEEVQNLLQSSKGIISCVLEDMIEHQKEMEELEKCNKAMKAEIDTLKAKVGAPDKDALLKEIDNLRKTLEEKDAEICRLQQSSGEGKDDEELEGLKELNKQMKTELQAACAGLKEAAKQGRVIVEDASPGSSSRREERAETPGSGSRREERSESPGSASRREERSESPRVRYAGVEPEPEDFDCCKVLQKETEDLKLQIDALNKLTEELKKENELLREIQQPCPDFSKELEEKCALENLLTLLQAELDAFKGQKMSDECEALRNELKRVMEQNCQLKALVDCYRQRLDLEKQSNELHQAKLRQPESDDEARARKGLGAGAERSPGWKSGETESRTDRSSLDEFGVPKKGKNASSKGSTEAEKKGLTDSCKEELDALRRENEKLKNSLKDAEQKIVALEKPGGAQEELLKELEKLKKEKEALAQQAAAGGAGSAGTGAATPGGAGTGAATPGGAGAGVATPGGAGAGAATPGGAGAGAATPGGAGAGAATPGGAGAGATTPGGAGAGAATPGGAGAGAATPGGAGAGAATPGRAGAGAATPGGAGAGAATPGGTGAGVATPGGAGAVDLGDKSKADCLAELEKLRKEKAELHKQLVDAGLVPGSAGGAKPDAKADCLKELEELRKEKNDLLKKLTEAGGGGKAGTDAGADAAGQDYLKELEQLRKEKADMQKELEQSRKDKADGLKELEELKKANNNLNKQLADAGQGISAPDRADLLKQIEQLQREKNEALAGGKGGAGAGAGAGVGAGGAVPGDVADLQARLRQLEEENAVRIKKLMEQHEKELANREKAYNENLNAMKSGYETDIRKLAERHKQSIMRLQELHDDEVQELNLNYETQFDSLQTQSQAAINDIAQGSAAKMRKLNEQHSREVRDIEQKFHVALDEKESEYLDALGNLQTALAKSRQELETLKKKGREGNVDQLRAQQAREIQKLRKTSAAKISALKDSFEKEKKKSDTEIESLKKQLKEHAKGDGVCECKFGKKKSQKPRDPTCPLDFNEVLEKILEEGLESLTFNEIALVHRKTCCALEGIVMKSSPGALVELEPPIGDGCPHTPILEADKQQLLSKIFTLENEILQKQRQTQEVIISMEVAIKKERCRLQEVRTMLESEQQKNSQLKLLLSSQTKLQSDLKKERDKLGNQVSVHQMLCEEKSRLLEDETKRKKCLEEEVERLKSQLRQICASYKDREQPGESKQDQIEVMRARLEQSIHQERRLALQLENEAKCRMQLQCQIQALRQSFKHMVNLPEVDIKLSQSPLEAKSAKERRNLDQIKEKKNKMKLKCRQKGKK